MSVDLQQFDHPAWQTAVGTFVSYALVLVAMTVLLFFVPYAIVGFL